MTKAGNRRGRQGRFPVHGWIGRGLAILIVPVSLSGAVLIGGDALDALVHPARYAVSGATLLAPDAYVEAARGALAPGERIARLTLPDGGGPVMVAATGGAGGRTDVYLDPPDARVLAVAPAGAGPVEVLRGLHGGLQPSGVGRAIVGWIGVAMLLWSLAGLWALRRRRHGGAMGGLHRLPGLWMALPLVVPTLTGVWLAFPALSGGGWGAAGKWGAGARPMVAPAQPVAVVIDHATMVGNGGHLRGIAWPTERNPDWTVTFARGAELGSVKVADDIGGATAAPVRPPAVPSRLIRRIHDGEGMGGVWRGVIALAGVVPVVLAATGVVLWVRGRRARAARG